MAFITQTPISDQIKRGRMPRIYSLFDTEGKKWDTLNNWSLQDNLTPTAGLGIDTYSSYDLDTLTFSETKQTPLSNQLDLINYKTPAGFTIYDTTFDIRRGIDNTGDRTSIPTWAKPYLADRSTYPIGKRAQLEGTETTRYTPSSLYSEFDNVFNSSKYFGDSRLADIMNNQISLNYNDLKLTTDGSRIQDFRQFKLNRDLLRKDGTSSLARNSKSGASIELVSRNRSAATDKNSGVYGAFDRETYFGMGNLGDTRVPTSERNDFTLQTEASTIWRLGGWVKNDKAQIIPFRGDKVTARDFDRGTVKSVYRWKRSNSDIGILSNSLLGKFADVVTSNIGSQLDQTKDFIKFYFLGPIAGSGNQLFDIFVFRAAIKGLTDSYNPQWQPIDYIGRADKNYIYTGFERSVDLNFSVYATSRDELKPMWRKLNYLATYTMPEYDSNYIMYRGKYLRITIGDLFINQPIIINNLTYTLQDADTTWDINIENDTTHKQVPMRVDVNMSIRMLTDHLPQYMGQAYSLYDQDKGNVADSSNWLSDSKTIDTLSSQIKDIASSAAGLFARSVNAGESRKIIKRES